MKPNYEQIWRQLLVVSKIKSAGSIPADDLFAELEVACEVRGFSYPSVRSARARMLQRDIRVIDAEMHIQIKYVTNKGYTITETEQGAPIDYETLFADFDMLTAIQPDVKISEYILPEHHRGKGSDNLFHILQAIKSCTVISFDYVFVRNNDKMRRYSGLHPYFLKENQERWYLVAQDEGKLKVFGLDRIKNLFTTGETFLRDANIKSEDLFRHSYGIWDDPDTPVEYVELKYDALDGKFLKSLPLHHSQRVLADNDEEFRISLNIKITNDFRMALLSRSRSLEVISPESLREYIHDIARGCAERNNLKKLDI